MSGKVEKKTAKVDSVKDRGKKGRDNVRQLSAADRNTSIPMKKLGPDHYKVVFGGTAKNVELLGTFRSLASLEHSVGMNCTELLERMTRMRIQYSELALCYHHLTKDTATELDTEEAGELVFTVGIAKAMYPLLNMLPRIVYRKLDKDEEEEEDEEEDDEAGK